MQIQICWFTPVLSWTRYPFVPVLRSITEMIAVLETDNTAHEPHVSVHLLLMIYAN